MDTHEEKKFLDAYDTYADALFRHSFFRIGKDRERARDMVQDTFMKTWEYMQKGNRVENIRALLYRILNNTIIDWYRKKKETSLDVLLEAGVSFGTDKNDALIEQLDGTHLFKLLEELEEPYQTVIRMRYLDELGPQEIAEILNETENAVSVRIHRGIKKFQEKVETQHHGK
jgi:RNA polymerase sigma-70 factor (ECF subfamily)